jgi:hypothetical protein
MDPPALFIAFCETQYHGDSCAQKAPFQTSSVVPAAEGKVTIKNDKNENYSNKKDITNLTDVDRFQPPKKSYVVWLESSQGPPRNVGRIVASDRLKVSFETVATLKPTKLFIRAEDNENVQFPGSMVVLITQVELIARRLNH